MTDVLASDRHKWTGLDIPLRVYVKGYASCGRAAILLAIFIVREVANDNRF
jgi:hypothetical protein